MESKFLLSQLVRLNEGKVTGTIVAIWLAVNDTTQYQVVWWDGLDRHQDWVREYELVAE